MNIAIIPARGGSKGLPGKNSMQLYGKPLIIWTIESALASGVCDKIVVSTEDRGISEISRSVDGVTIRDRPMELASDSASTMDVIVDVLESIEATDDDVIVLLQPTSPLRNVDDVQRAIALFKKGRCDSTISVKEYDSKAYWALYLEDGYLMPLAINHLERRQALPKIFIPNGAIYISTVGHIKIHRSFTIGRCLPFIMPEERSIDIDTLADFDDAEKYLRRE